MSKEQMYRQLADKVQQLPKTDIEKLLYVIKGMELSNIATAHSA